MPRASHLPAPVDAVNLVWLPLEPAAICVFWYAQKIYELINVLHWPLATRWRNAAQRINPLFQLIYVYLMVHLARVPLLIMINVSVWVYEKKTETET